jgi:hypothetical protein
MAGFFSASRLFLALDSFLQILAMDQLPFAYTLGQSAGEYLNWVSRKSNAKAEVADL